jgi:hypothetical protein
MLMVSTSNPIRFLWARSSGSGWPTPCLQILSISLRSSRQWVGQSTIWWLEGLCIQQWYPSHLSLSCTDTLWPVPVMYSSILITSWVEWGVEPRRLFQEGTYHHSPCCYKLVIRRVVCRIDFYCLHSSVLHGLDYRAVGFFFTFKLLQWGFEPAFLHVIS